MPEWDGKTPRVNLGEASPAHGEGSHKYRFGQHPVMPWHLVDCPKCGGEGWYIMTVMNEEDPIRCDFCYTVGKVKEFERRAYLRNQEQE